MDRRRQPQRADAYIDGSPLDCPAQRHTATPGNSFATALRSKTFLRQLAAAAADSCDRGKRRSARVPAVWPKRSAGPDPERMHSPVWAPMTIAMPLAQANLTGPPSKGSYALCTSLRRFSDRDHQTAGPRHGCNLKIVSRRQTLE